ncbi:MAG: ribosomal protein S18-alanine N-acetyltransferase [Lachnospiraceae bacterium]|nr:ribosomal protein S18-alanine N-acetyltransferase [Lachnospiraceae bacterium]
MEHKAAGTITFAMMERSDCEAAAVIEQQLFSRPWSKKALEESLEREESCYVTAKAGSVLLGYCGLYLTFGEGYINQVAVKSSCQGQGIGKQMLTFLLTKARERGMNACSLEVRVSNERARALYASLKFEESGIRPRFYEDPTEDAMILWRRWEER